MFKNGTEGTGSNVKSLRIFLLFLATFSVIKYIVLIVSSNPFLIKSVCCSVIFGIIIFPYILKKTSILFIKLGQKNVFCH